MAITFDQSQAINQIFRYDASANSYFGIRHTDGTTAFDFFDDTATAGDYIAFGFDYGVWHNLSIDVGTALVATSITVVWEYWAKSGWTALTVTDPSNGFQTAGAHTITFTVPDDWEATYVNTTYGGLGGTATSYRGTYIRARITAVSGLTEGGAHSAVAVNCSNWTIKLDGANDYRLSDIQSANDAGSWGVMTTLGSYSRIMANIDLGDGTNATKLSLISEFIELGSSSFYTLLTKRTASILEMGETVAGAYGTDYYNGAFLKYWNHAIPWPANNYNIWRGTLNMYASTFWKRSGRVEDPQVACTCDIQSSQLSGYAWYFNGASGNLKNTLLDMGSTSLFFYQYSSSLILNNAFLSRSAGLVAGANGVVVSNLDFSGGQEARTGNNNTTAYVRDFIFNDIPAQIRANSSNNKINAQFTLSLSILDEQNNAVATPTVNITDSQGTAVFNDVWSADVILTVYQKRQTSPDTGATDYNPFTLEIKKSGYKTYKSKMNITAKTSLKITLDKVKNLNLSPNCIIQNQ
jgi:hypothetical protein